MTTNRYYKIGNTWVAWQEAHNLYGYTKTPSTSITYKSTNPSTWGEPVSPANGYYDGDISDPISGLYFSTGSMGWFDANHMASYGRMPNECVIDDTMFTDGNVVSACARLKVVAGLSPVELYSEQQAVDVAPDYYLIASAINLGWHTLDEWEELGWTMTDPNTLYFGGDFSGNNIRMESVDGGGGLIEKYASYKALFELRGWEPGGLFIDKPRMMGICGVITETSDSVVLVEVPKMLSFGRIEFTGSLAAGGIPESGVIEEYQYLQYLDINLGVRWDPVNTGWLAKTFGVDDWWWAGILSQSDLTALQNFGCGYKQTTDSAVSFAGPIGALEYEDEKFDYELLDMFTGVGEGSAPENLSNYFFSRYYGTVNTMQYNGSLIINSIGSSNTSIKSYRIRIIPK